MHTVISSVDGGTLKPACILDANEPEAIAQAAEIIRDGGLVAFPTETVYGLGADASNPVAVARIFEVKKRPSIDPLIVHVADFHTARSLGVFPDPLSDTLMSRFWPGPLTLVVPRISKVPLIVTAGLETVALRMPNHSAALELIRKSGRAIAAPSANPFGYVSPTAAQHVADQLADKVDLILDGGPCPVGVESTILSLAGPAPQILRAGGVTAEELEQVVGRISWATEPASLPTAPGQLVQHYATRTPLVILEEANQVPSAGGGAKIGLLTFLPHPAQQHFSAVEVLSNNGDLREAAANLFAALRRLDRKGLDCLYASALPEVGLGIAIMDRLRRCAAGRESC